MRFASSAELQATAALADAAITRRLVRSDALIRSLDERTAARRDFGGTRRGARTYR